jgi:hypothetical protein
MKFSGIVFFLFSLILNSGCSDFKNPFGLNSQIISNQLPIDEATTEEKQKIDQALTKIESLASELGYENNFRRIPVVVIAGGPPIGKKSGYCSWDENRSGQFIVLNRTIFATDSSPNRFDFLFGVLLHEIGHCYFGRTHDSRVFKKEGYRILIEVVDESGGSEISMDEVPVSIMYTKSSQESFVLIKVPQTFQKYFVAELLGLAQINSDEELVSIPGVRIVPK